MFAIWRNYPGKSSLIILLPIEVDKNLTASEVTPLIVICVAPSRVTKPTPRPARTIATTLSALWVWKRGWNSSPALPNALFIMIFPGMLFKAVIGTCDNILADLRTEGRHPVPAGDMNIKVGFSRVGANEWDPLRDRFRDSPLKRAG